MISSPQTWRIRGSSLTTKTFSNDTRNCSACEQECKEGVGCINKVSNVQTAFCWSCWAGDDKYNCKTCGCDVDDSLVVYCEGCGIPEHAGCTCNASVIKQDNWMCCFCTSKPTKLKNGGEMSEEMKAILTLQKLVRQNNIEKLQKELKETNKKNVDMQITLKRRDSAIQALISDTQTQSTVIKRHEKKLLELFEKNKQLSYKYSRLQLHNKEMEQTLCHAIKKRKREVDISNTATLSAISQLSQVIKRMRTQVKH